MSERKTLKDVADAAGVSQMTVSRVIRESGYVAPETRDHVLQVIKHLGYVPNKIAGALARQKANQVAVIIPSMVNNVFTDVMHGITQELSKADYHPVVGVSDYDMVKEENLLISMLSWRPAGIILTNLNHTDRTRRVVQNAQVPIVEVMDISTPPIGSAVGLDHRKAAIAMVDHLIAKGYCRFGFLGWNAGGFAASDRYQATKTRLEQRGYALYAPDCFSAPPDSLAGKWGMKQLLADQPETDVVLFSNDLAAVGGMMHCLEHGIRIPEDVAIAGFTGLRIGESLPRVLTTIHTHRFETGRIAARNILKALSGTPVKKVTDLGFEIIPGTSS